MNNRWYSGKTSIGQFNKNKGDYYVGTINEQDKETFVVFGKNKNANKIQIELLGKSYTEDLKDNECFVVVFPSLENLDNNSDIYNVFHGKESNNFKINFYDSSGNKCNNMKLYNNQ